MDVNTLLGCVDEPLSDKTLNEKVKDMHLKCLEKFWKLWTNTNEDDKNYRN